MERNLLINCTHGTVIRLLPAMNLTEEQAHEGCDILGEVLKKQAGNHASPVLVSKLRTTMRHLLTLADLTAAEIERIFSIAEELRKQERAGYARAAVGGSGDGPVV